MVSWEIAHRKMSHRIFGNFELADITHLEAVIWCFPHSGSATLGPRHRDRHLGPGYRLYPKHAVLVTVSGSQPLVAGDDVPTLAK